MTAGDLAVTLAALLCALGFAALIVVLVRVLDALTSLRGEVESLRAETRPLLADAPLGRLLAGPGTAADRRRATRGGGAGPADVPAGA